MAISKALIASILLSLLLIAEADQMAVKDDVAKGSVPTKIDCGGACNARCQLSSRPNLCKRACGTCCSRCNCVPPGTSGNQDVCPCYANMTTRGNKRKCP
ncbi:snakin-2-like [Juglans microcarpa x Juglans regia]|uniref:snakin-2-like n=1 Tax=Juglans microcarpa x Juglans regia TaxID=2249226 RepID=UPI001B7EFBCE|nr:snakin-2-like [Juglans microcarpa x Juglans regia]